MMVQVDDDGCIVIPEDVRERLDIDSGSCLEIHIESGDERDGRITLTLAKQEANEAETCDADAVTAEDVEVIEWVHPVGRIE